MSNKQHHLKGVYAPVAPASAPTLHQAKPPAVNHALAPLGVVLTPYDLERQARHRTFHLNSNGERVYLGYEEHASYPIEIDLPLCGVCGEVSIRCPHPGIVALQPGEPFRGTK